MKYIALIIVFFSFSPILFSNYDDALNEYESGNFDSSKTIIYQYMKKDGLYDCDGYELISKLKLNDGDLEGSTLFSELGILCLNLSNDILFNETLEKIINNNDRNNQASFNLSLYEILIDREIYLDYIYDEIIFSLEGENFVSGGFDYFKDLNYLLLDVLYLKNEPGKYVERLNMIFSNEEIDNNLIKLNRFGKTLILLKNLDDISSFEPVITSVYGNKYFNLIDEHIKLKKYLKGELEVDNLVVYEMVSTYVRIYLEYIDGINEYYGKQLIDDDIISYLNEFLLSENSYSYDDIDFDIITILINDIDSIDYYADHNSKTSLLENKNKILIVITLILIFSTTLVLGLKKKK